MMVFAWVMLVVMILGYGTANFLQGVAATKGKADERLDPRLLVRLARQKVYLCGVAFQALGMLTAIIARRDLPLFLVQAAIGAGIAITALLGVVIYRWRLARAEILLMVVIAVGLAALIFSANPSSPKSPNGITLIVMGALVFVFAGAANFAARLHGSGGSVVLGALGGLAFGASAIATRPLVNADSLKDFLTDPLLYIFIAHTIAGQLIFGLALQRGATTAASAAMNAMAAPVAVVGLLLLGDKIVEGRQFLAAIGFVATVSAVIGLAFYAQPQKHEGSRRFGQRDSEATDVQPEMPEVPTETAPAPSLAEPSATQPVGGQ